MTRGVYPRRSKRVVGFNFITAGDSREFLISDADEWMFEIPRGHAARRRRR